MLASVRPRPDGTLADRDGASGVRPQQQLSEIERSITVNLERVLVNEMRGDEMYNSSFAPHSDQWIALLRRSLRSLRTIDCYERDLGDVGRALTIVVGRPCTAGDLSLLEQRHVDAMVTLWRESGLSIPTILRRFAALRGFARFLEDESGLRCRGLLSARLPMIVRAPRHPFPPQTVAALNAVGPAAAHGECPWVELRNLAIFLVQVSTGLTTAEVVTINREELLSPGGLIIVASTHLRPRLVQVSPLANELLQRYLAKVPFDLTGEDPLFVTVGGDRLKPRTVQVAFRRWGAALGVPVLYGPMCLRHSFGRALAESGERPEVVARALGVGVTSVIRYFDNEG